MVISKTEINDLAQAIKTSKVPDLDLGMRGENARSSTSGSIEVYQLHDPVCVIDGLQRIPAALQLLRQDPAAQPRIGAVVHFNTNWADSPGRKVGVGGPGSIAGRSRLGP